MITEVNSQTVDQPNKSQHTSSGKRDDESHVESHSATGTKDSKSTSVTKEVQPLSTINESDMDDNDSIQEIISDVEPDESRTSKSSANDIASDDDSSEPSPATESSSERVFSDIDVDIPVGLPATSDRDQMTDTGPGIKSHLVEGIPKEETQLSSVKKTEPLSEVHTYSMMFCLLANKCL